MPDKRSHRGPHPEDAHLFSQKFWPALQSAASDLAWLLSPVSNSGRLKTIMQQIATQNAWPWTITLVQDPDPVLARSNEIIVTADSIILDGHRNPAGTPSPRWTNLAAHIVQFYVSTATII